MKLKSVFSGLINFILRRDTKSVEAAPAPVVINPVYTKDDVIAALDVIDNRSAKIRADASKVLGITSDLTFAANLKEQADILVEAVRQNIGK